MNNKVIILTGAIQTGKTTLLQQFCKQYHCAGILSPVINNKRMFYNIANPIFFDMEASGNENTLAIGKYLFTAAAFERAGEILSAAADKNDIAFLVVDEIGPLEIKQQKGLYNYFKKILSSPRHYTLIAVIRQGLVEEALHHFNIKQAQVLNIAEMKAHFAIG